MEECNICCEYYDTSIRRKISCPYCHFDACMSCQEINILNNDEMKCMKCEKPYDRKFLSNNFKQNFITKKYNPHRAKIVYEQEKTLLPDTLNDVKKIKLLKEYREEFRDLQQKYHAYKRSLDIRRRNIEIYGINSPNSITKNEEGKIIEVDQYSSNNSGGVEIKREMVFIRACGHADCRGYLSSQWKCALCNNYTCKDCMEVIGLKKECDHVCDPDTLASAKLIKQDSKPCPRCRSLIHKLSGCDQMWCTVCHIAFSWKTGKEEKHFHNPHYYEYMANRGVNPDQVIAIPCGHRNLDQRFKHHVDNIDIPKQHKVQLSNMIRMMVHNKHVEFPAFYKDYFERNKKLRIRYLLGEIDEAKFKTLLQRSEKKNLKDEEYRQVFELFENVFIDIVLKYASKENKPSNMLEIFVEIKNLTDHCNNLLEEISKSYKNTRYYIWSDLSIKTSPEFLSTISPTKPVKSIGYIGQKL